MIPLRYLPSGELDPQWHGEVHQDAFAFEQCGGINNGTFLDLGCWHPIVGNNTYALEQMGWRGLLVDSDLCAADLCGIKRSSLVICSTAQHLNWSTVCAMAGIGPQIDYLSLDVEGAELTVLQQLFMAGFRFRVITCEHNRHSHDDGERNLQRALLSAQGYKLTIPDVQNSTGLEYEDWWTR